MGAGEFLPMLAVGGCVICAIWLSLVAMKNWTGNKYLCDNCVFNNENDCHKPERPTALECLAYSAPMEADRSVKKLD